MKKNTTSFTRAVILLAAITATFLASCANNATTPPKAQSEQPPVISDRGNPATEVLLRRFDSLDFEVYSHQKWDSLQLSHADNILVHYPDGSTTKGLHDHIEALKPMFVFAPDTKISEHPVKFGINGWTSVIGTMEGTFTKPMPIGNGRFIQPTGKKFKLSMNTVGNWENGKMIEEYLFWDNQAFMKQIGLGQ